MSNKISSIPLLSYQAVDNFASFEPLINVSSAAYE